MDAHTIALNLNGTWRNGQGSAPCPVCQTERRRDQNALSISENSGRLLLHCFRSGCDFSDIAKAINLPTGASQADPVDIGEMKAKRDAYSAAQLAKARGLWERSKQIAGTKGETYFRGRGITVPLPAALRFMPDIFHGPSGSYASAIIAKVEPTGAIHRTFLDKQGAKLSKSAKMMLGQCAGGAVRLREGEKALLVGEGIESTLSAALALENASTAVWACLSTSGMKSLTLPLMPGELIIAPDNDAAGSEASQCLANRAMALGWSVSLFPPPSNFGDWNDHVLGVGDAAA